MIKKILQNYGSLTGIRILSRIFQFLLKTYLIRNLLSKSILSHMVHLDLILTVSLHILKHCLKPSFQKVSLLSTPSQSIKSGMNLINLGVLITTICSVVVCFFQIYYLGDEGVMGFQTCVGTYGLSVVLQALSQRFNVINVLNYNYLKTALIQMAAFLPKTLFVFIAAQTGMFQSYGILVFGFSQLIYSILFFSISFFTTPQQYRTFWLVKIKPNNNNIKENEMKQSMDIKKQVQISNNVNINDNCKGKQNKQDYYYIDSVTLQSSRQFSFLTILRMFLQQFQKLSLIFLNISQFSSTYTLISNLGSIIVRYLFAPLDEIVYNYFSRGDQKQSLKTLVMIVKTILLFSGLSIVFGHNYSEDFLAFLYGNKWVDQDSTFALRVYTLLLSVLGINGIVQAFLFAKGKQSFKTYKYISIIPTIVYIMLSFYFIMIVKLGTGSFFLANSISMLIRIVICWNLQIKKHISLIQFIKEIKPSNTFLISLIFTYLMGNPSIPIIGIVKLDSSFKNMIIGGCLFMINISVIAYQNKSLIKQKLTNIIKKNKSQ